jgi:NAD-dependent deacetylase sirtuin 2
MGNTIHHCSVNTASDEITIPNTEEENYDDAISSVAQLILSDNIKNIIILTGAGCSTAANIPDFRSPGTGLYHNLEKYKDLEHPTDVLTLRYLRKNPYPYFELKRDFYVNDYKPTPAHYFIKLLSSKGVLLRLYTQNIDGLDKKTDLPSDKLFECHGTLSTATCIDCKKPHDIQVVVDHIKDEPIRIPYCDCGGIVKPDVVLFEEDLPANFVKQRRSDQKICDMFIVIGSSLQVYPVADMVNFVNTGVHRVLINRERCGPWDPKEAPKMDPVFDDYFIGGDIQQSIFKLADELGWRQELEELIHQGSEKAHNGLAQNAEEKNL